MKEKKARVEDALHATRAAVEEGVVPGGGVALLRALKGIANLKGANDDQDVGINILRKAVEEPLRQIVGNAGADASVVLNAVVNGKGNYGFNAATGEYGDMVKFGIIDPTKVTRLGVAERDVRRGSLADDRGDDRRGAEAGEGRRRCAARPRRHGRHDVSVLELLTRTESPASCGAFFLVRPAGRTRLGGASPLHTRHGEVLAEGKGSLGDWRSEGSRKQSAGATNRKRIEATRRGERAKDAKPDTCTERGDVDPTRISVKVGAQYPGRSDGVLLSYRRSRGRGGGSSEVSRGRSRDAYATKGRTCQEWRVRHDLCAVRAEGVAGAARPARSCRARKARWALRVLDDGQATCRTKRNSQRCS